jgi:hypothetical protein
MKITLCTLLILALTLPVPLRAQDAPTRPLRDPASDIEPSPLPSSSTTPISTPAATPHKVELPVPEPRPSSTPEPSPPPAPTANATPESSAAEAEQTPAKTKTARARAKRRTRTKEKTSGNPTVAAAPEATPASREDLPAVAAKLKEMEKQWEASFNDPAVIEKSVTDDFVGTSPAGKLMTKKDLLREAREISGTPPPKTITRDLDVYFHGGDLAIVTGAAKQLDRNRSGQIVERTFRFTDTWVERGGQWRCVASQSMLVPRQ